VKLTIPLYLLPRCRDVARREEGCGCQEHQIPRGGKMNIKIKTFNFLHSEVLDCCAK
jgi:hypothetical protein